MQNVHGCCVYSVECISRGCYCASDRNTRISGECVACLKVQCTWDKPSAFLRSHLTSAPQNYPPAPSPPFIVGRFPNTTASCLTAPPMP